MEPVSVVLNVSPIIFSPIKSIEKLPLGVESSIFIVNEKDLLLFLFTDDIFISGSEVPDIDKEFNPNYYREKGYLDVEESPAFRKIVDACNCLGQNYISVQQAWFKSKVYPNHNLWFPKFYENEEWDNQISSDGKIITEKCKNPDKYKEWFKDVTSNLVKRITFPRSIDNLGFKLYRFAGIFETDLNSSSLENGVIHRLKKTRIEI